MNGLLAAKGLDLRTIALFLFPFILWTAVWGGLNAGEAHRLFQWDGAVTYIQKLRSTAPLWAASCSIIVIGWNVWRKNSGGFQFFSPLSLVFVYGLTGVISSLAFSTRLEVSLYWAAAYISLPLVLWGVTWGPNALKLVERIIDMNWMVVLVITFILFFIGLVWVDLWDELWRPSAWVECNLYNNWFKNTSDTLRPTMVGRFAAVSGLVAMSQLWRGNHRVIWVIWVVIFVAAVLLLFTSGARTSIVGFGAGAILISFFYTGKKGFVYGAIILAVTVPVLWLTDFGNTLVDSCFGDRAVHVVPVQEAVVPVQEAAVPVQEAAVRVQEAAVPVQEAAVPVQEAAVRVQEAVSPADSDVSAEAASDVSSRTGEWIFSKMPILTMTGRVFVWGDALYLIAERPILGYGFHADRIVLREHMHNTYLHALIQTGILGTIPLLGGLLLTWVLFVRAALRSSRLTDHHRHTVILIGGILAFFSLRTIPESTGAFFGVDLVLLAPLLLYLELVSRNETAGTEMK